VKLCAEIFVGALWVLMLVWTWVLCQIAKD
jgi:hypothetical protein